MTKFFSRRLFLGGLASFSAGQTLAGAPLTSPWPVARPSGFGRYTAPPVEDLVASAQLGGKVGFMVADARTGTVLEAFNPLVALPPASVAKAATAVYALSALGGDFRFNTRLVATGPVTGGKLEGDLILAGGGDPMLDTDALGEMAAELKAAGVHEVTGRFKVYAGALPYQRMIDAEQPEHLGYNPSVGGLNLNFNRVHFQWEKASGGYSVHMNARAQKFNAAVSVAQMQVVNRAAPIYTYSQAGDVDKWTVARGALGNAGARWLPVRRPDLYAAEVFQTLARAHGIVLKKAEEARSLPAGARVLVTRESASLSTIVRLMLKYSTNLTAETIGLMASKKRGKNPRSLSDSAREMSRWMKSSLGARHASFRDHSGLNDASRVSASDMVRMLVSVGPGSALHGLMKEIQPVNKNGDALSGANYQIRAKTGTLNFVSSLAGYITLADDRPLAFAIFSGDIPRRDALSLAERERPEGGRAWSGRSRWMQQQLLRRWASIYAT